MFGLLAVVLLFPLSVMVLYGVSGSLAFNRGTSKFQNDAELKRFSAWLTEDRSLPGYLKKILIIIAVMSAIIFVVASLPKIVFIGYEALIKYYSFMVVFILDRYISDLSGMKSFSARRVIFQACLLLASASWIFYPNWLTIDVSALLFALMLLIHLRNFTLKSVTVLAAAIMLYDALMVFGTQTMQKAAGRFTELPVMLIIPGSLSLNTEPILRIGLGDIVLPGVIVMLAFRKSVFYRNFNLAAASMCGYSFGYLITLFVLYVAKFPQPATIYLIPGAWLGFMLAAYWHGVLKEIAAE